MEFINTRNEGAKQELVVGYRLGLYDPDPKGSFVKYVGRLFGRDVHERQIMEHAINRYNRLTGGDSESHLCLGVFPVEG